MHAYYTLQNAKAHPSVLGQDIMRPTAADISMGVSQVRRPSPGGWVSL